MTQTFVWTPLLEATGSASFSVLSARYGDGYEQTAKNGINNKSQSWPLTFRGKDTKIRPIRDFLDAHEGARAFLWTPPLGAQGYYKCRTYTLKPLGLNNYELAATFDQSFQP